MRPSNKKSLPIAALSVATMLLLGVSICVTTAQPPLNMNLEEETFLAEGHLVLTDGRVLTGQISILDRGYLLVTSSGRSTIPFTHVTCHARTLKEAYRKQRDGMTRPTADLHTELARWCLVNKLFAEAEMELQSALALQSYHVGARKLLRQFDAQKASAKPDYDGKEAKSTFDKLLIEKEFNPAQPIGGIDAELARQYVLTIEPILLNGCSNTSCHGSSAANDFRLTQLWNIRGNTRRYSHENLNSVLQQIDPLDPGKSPLLTILDEEHGGRGKKALTGTRVAAQKQTLELWTYRVAKELEKQQRVVRATEPKASSEKEAGGSGVMPAGYEILDKIESDRLQEARNEQAVDPFDPAIFNRKVHGN
ncbi:hypothetical protein [Rubinisphaera margarita]|uniref:hypothetical protein n=1 Tax=Rubinisphaera margarita TaxID=2909586 RepID=UPI001EE88B0F|nr:hypothetical protein [Rubinisphaera margarita]MCG6158581.1 hypothetical protein [Rubinisphaera margarita]